MIHSELCSACVGPLQFGALHVKSPLAIILPKTWAKTVLDGTAAINFFYLIICGEKLF